MALKTTSFGNSECNNAQTQQQEKEEEEEALKRKIGFFFRSRRESPHKYNISGPFATSLFPLFSLPLLGVTLNLRKPFRLHSKEEKEEEEQGQTHTKKDTQSRNFVIRDRRRTVCTCSF